MIHTLVDPIIAWPHLAGSLQVSIAEMQRLNPNLGLRRAVSTRKTDYAELPPHFRDELEAAGPPEYLVYDGTSLDVVAIHMPAALSDQIMSAITEMNRERGTHKTDLGNFRNGPRRIERTAGGGLLIRPRSDLVASLNGRFSLLYQGWGRDRSGGERQITEEIVRFQSQWGIFRSGHEAWEVDFAYHSPEYLYRTDIDEEYWRTTPIGTISYIDRHDLPLDEHFARARAIVAAGSVFAIVCDAETGEALVFRMSGVERFTGDFRLPEWAWFTIPLRVAA